LPHLHRIFSNNRYSNFGELAETFSRRLLNEFGQEGEACVVCNSATSGLSGTLIASGCTGSVIVPAFTFPATYGAVYAAGLKPLLMDVNLETWAIRPEDLDDMLQKSGAKAVILVTPFGLKTDFSSHILSAANTERQS
jgi:dTDP-4-amino-4,6-dideoxygalactose transaminase